MPIYDFKCKSCGRKVMDILITHPIKGKNFGEVVQKCVCGGTEFEKLPSKVSARFKGDGWASSKPREEE